MARLTSGEKSSKSSFGRVLVTGIRPAPEGRFIRERPVDPETWKPMAELVSALTAALAREGYLSGDVIDADPQLPSTSHVRRRFGNLIKAYNAAGWDVQEEEVRPLANARRWRRNRASEDLPDQLRQDIVHGD